MFKIIFFLFIALFSSIGFTADLLFDIMEKKQITVGVKADYPPWGMLSNTGEIVGFEPDLAEKIAESLGVELILKPVTSGNRFQLLEEGSVDILIATVGDTAKRRTRVRMLEPHYYRSGVTAIIHKSNQVSHWNELQGQRVCLYGGAYFNQSFIEEYDIEPLIFFNTRDAQLALLTNKCMAWVYDDSAINKLLKSNNWKEYESTLPIIYPINWSIVVQKGQQTDTLARLLETILVDWQRSATLYTYAIKWKLSDTKHLADKAWLWNQKDDDGNYLCQFDSLNHSLPHECNQSPKEQVSDASHWWPLSSDENQWLVMALVNTLAFTLVAVLCTLFIAYFFTLSSLLSNPFIRKPLTFVINVQRSIPPILLLYLLYFGVLSSITADSTVLEVITKEAVITGLFVLVLYTSAGIAYLLESSLTKQNERTFSTIHFAFLENQHGVTANLINLVKASTMVSALSVPNAVLVVNSLVASHGQALLLMTLLALFYLCEVVLFSRCIDGLFHRLKQRFQPS